jgi:phosphatidylserine/phosphatidylglycerophosphate/cardiolipin synthase-like enzyme
MKKTLFTLFVIPFVLLVGQENEKSAVELVESIPLESTLDNPEIRDTPEVWREMIDRAQQTLDIEQFYISNEPGEPLENILNAVRAAADRGVRVRLIVDARMYKTYPDEVDRLGNYGGIEARRIDFTAVGGGIQHAKYFIVDSKVVFIGSQNFDWRALKHIHELGLRIENRELAKIFGDVFALDWNLAAKDSSERRYPSRQYKTPLTLMTDLYDTVMIWPTMSPIGWIPDSTLWDETALVHLIDTARKTLILQFLSYSPIERRGGLYTAIDGAIRRAAARGVKVRMIVSDWTKGGAAFKYIQELSMLQNIEVACTVIPEWSRGYVSFARVEHCKFIAADSENFWLGTSNCEKSYYYTSRNLGLICRNRKLTLMLEKIFLKSWESPYKELITQEGTYVPREHGEKK